MVKYLITDSEQITSEKLEQISIYNPIYNPALTYKKESKTNYNTFTHYSKRLANTDITLVIENENFTEFSFLDELKYYEKEKYKLLLNSFGELEEINYIDESNTTYDCMIINGIIKYCLKYPFQSVIFKNCLNLTKISNILETYQQILVDELISIHSKQQFSSLNIFLWNCPNFVFNFKPKLILKNKFYMINDITFHISNNFTLIYKYSNELLQHILHQQYGQIKSLTNDNQNLKKENETNNNIILEMVERMSLIENKLNLSLSKSAKLAEKLENKLMLLEDELSNKLNKNSIIYSFYK